MALAAPPLMLFLGARAEIIILAVEVAAGRKKELARIMVGFSDMKQSYENDDEMR